MPWAIIDTNVYIGHWERGQYHEGLAAVRRAFVVRHSSVVLAELRRGARSREARRLVEGLFRLAAIRWEPTGADWWEAGRLIRKIGDLRGWDRSKRRDFQNDALIALTARRRGATVVTADQRDFDLLSQAIGVPIFAL